MSSFDVDYLVFTRAVRSLLSFHPLRSWPDGHHRDQGLRRHGLSRLQSKHAAALQGCQRMELADDARESAVDDESYDGAAQGDVLC